ncbi:MAG: 16S rRNA (adenine(1518)-N(6)/adenine(1519)-N(6))-dimethyltransferase RsmA [Bacillota bacterium]
MREPGELFEDLLEGNILMNDEREKENNSREFSPGEQAAPKITSPSVLREMLHERGLQPRRALGQHFLVDENILEKILQAAALTPQDLVIDIGAGPGALSLVLAKRVAVVVAIEQDRGLAAFLREQAQLRGLANINVIEGDVRRLDLKTLFYGTDAINGTGNSGSAITQKGVKVVANLPYYLTTPLLFQLLQSSRRPELLILMVQLEVARRMLAEPGNKDYGTLSVLCRYYCRSRLLFKVSRHVFYPQPAVDSAVVLLETLPCPAVSVPDERFFWAVVRAAFQKRRKTILNAMEGVGQMGREEWEDILAQAAIDPRRRGETLSLSEFAKLGEIFYNK